MQSHSKLSKSQILILFMNFPLNAKSLFKIPNLVDGRLALISLNIVDNLMLMLPVSVVGRMREDISIGFILVI